MVEETLGNSSASDEDEEEGESVSRLEAFEKSDPVQFTIMGIVFLNTVLMALEAELRDDNALYEQLEDWFLVIFTVELCFRLLLYRCSFFTRPGDRAWNIFDLTVVLLNVLGRQAATKSSSDNSNKDLKRMQYMMMLRVLRILRVLRAFRIFRHFRKLQTLGRGLFDSLASVVWVGVLFLLTMFVYAILITSVAGKNYKAFGPDAANVDENFGTVLRSMQTLFLFLTLDDWSSPARTVNRLYPVMELLFVSYIILGAFTLLSLLTGLMANKMNEARTREEQTISKEKAKKLDLFLGHLKKIFDEADTSGDCKMDEDEFRELVRGPHAKELYNWGVPAIEDDNVASTFSALDWDQAGFLTWDAFRDGLVRLSKPFTPRDMMWLESSICRLDKALLERMECHPGIQWDHKLLRIHARVSLLYDRVERLDAKLQVFFKQVGYTYN